MPKIKWTVIAAARVLFRLDKILLHLLDERRFFATGGNNEGSTNQWPASGSQRILTLDSLSDPA
jgi:hypothetical protein